MAIEDGLDVEHRTQRVGTPADTFVTFLGSTLVDVEQIRRHHVGVRLFNETAQTCTDLARRAALTNQANRLSRLQTLPGKHVARGQHGQTKTLGNARLATHFLVLRQDRPRRLHGVIVNRAATTGNGQAKHIVEIEHQTL